MEKVEKEVTTSFRKMLFFVVYLQTFRFYTILWFTRIHCFGHRHCSFHIRREIHQHHHRQMSETQGITHWRQRRKMQMVIFVNKLIRQKCQRYIVQKYLLIHGYYSILIIRFSRWGTTESVHKTKFAHAKYNTHNSCGKCASRESACERLDLVTSQPLRKGIGGKCQHGHWFTVWGRNWIAVRQYVTTVGQCRYTAHCRCNVKGELSAKQQQFVHQQH